MSINNSQIPFICKKLYAKNLIVGSDGNVSEKLENQILITASGGDKSDIKEKDLCVLDKKGQPLKGKPSSEKYMHLAVYQRQKQAQAIIHAHPPSAIALSLARPKWKTLPLALPEIVITLGEVPFVPYAPPGTKELGEVLKPFVQKSRALILSQHGALVWGKNLNEACLLMEQLEHACQILCLSESMGKTTLLKKQEIQKLHSLFKK